MMKLRRILLAISSLPLFAAAAGAQFIFYDYDNSRLYSANNFYSAGDITSAQYGRGRDVHATSGWLINTTNGAGLYNENQGVHFYSSGGVWSLVGSGSLRLQLLSHHISNGPTAYGSVYSDGTNFGLLNSAGSWVLYSAGAATLVNVPGSIQIGSYGGIVDVNSYSSYGTIALDTAKNGYYGMLFSNASTSANLMFDGGGNGGAYYEGNGGWRDYITKGSRRWDIYGTVNANSAVYSAGYQALTKVVYRLYCNGGDWYCYPPGCASGYSATATGCGVLGMTYTCYRDCCWGND